MSGERPSSPRVSDRASRTTRRGAVLVLLGASAMAGLLLVSALVGLGGSAPLRTAFSQGGDHSLAVPPAPATFSLVNLTANNTTVDVSMPFNISVNVVNLTGGALNASNYTFVWTGLPAFVPGTPGSGCTGPTPGSNNSPVLNCTAASPGALTISVSATNITGGPSNSTGPITIAVNPLPTETAFTVSSAAIAGANHISVAVNTSITFIVTASGGTSPLSFAYAGLPLGCSSNASTFQCAPNRAGVYNVSVTTSDSYGYTAGPLNVTVTVTAPVKTTSSGIGTTGWAIVIGILVVGALVTVALFVQAGREERRGRMGMEEASQGSSGQSGGEPPMGGTPPPGPPT
jgi:hypothetical protein